ncbi:hypothetical protein EVAR_72096_1 [Eumeta japonica]|uniref:Uncharacterized protein n=1 Tax=Eumeta variegata TaxID=151549 RepID=A0A4C1TF71_EUMVA|nr:hypothetical protein EVAR_72096_1 [Eumeta japonica]
MHKDHDGSRKASTIRPEREWPTNCGILSTVSGNNAEVYPWIVRLAYLNTSLWLCYRIALRALFEGYNIGTMGLVAQGDSKENSANVVEVPTRLQHGGSSGAVAYQQNILEIPGRVVAVKLRHDAHLSASSHLLGMPDL